MKAPDSRLLTIAFFALTGTIGVGATYVATQSWGPALAAGLLQVLLMRIAFAVSAKPEPAVRRVRAADRRDR